MTSGEDDFYLDFLLVPGLHENFRFFAFYGEFVSGLVGVSIFNGFSNHFSQGVAGLGADAGAADVAVVVAGAVATDADWVALGAEAATDAVAAGVGAGAAGSSELSPE